uniref:Uncharacterized protein n=1 Tax=Anguilla anguilla TaxID=7936 RepID=A0A0E9SSF9_ANGAN
MAGMPSRQVTPCGGMPHTYTAQRIWHYYIAQWRPEMEQGVGLGKTGWALVTEQYSDLPNFLYAHSLRDYNNIHLEK